MKMCIIVRFQICFLVSLSMKTPKRHHLKIIHDQYSCDPDSCDVITLDLVSIGHGCLSRGEYVAGSVSKVLIGMVGYFGEMKT